MNTIEHKEYLKEFQDYTRKINSSKENATSFYVKVGINTPTGRLKKGYYHRPLKK